MARPHPQGKKGEDIAARFLISRGYKVKDRNVRSPGGEIDIVAYEGARKELVFVEVKSRTSRMFGWPEESVGTQKRARLRRAADRYITEKHIDAHAAYRFDIIAIELAPGEDKARVVHYKNIEME